LIDFTSAHGQFSDTNPQSDNLLFTGDSLDVLRVLAESPEYRREYRGKVKQVYIDPPFNTGQTFAHYDDWLDHSTWLSFMRDRLVLIRDLLTSDGSVWVHLDDAEMHRMRCLLDEVFGAQNFVATIVWQKATGTRQTDIASIQDYILVFARSRPLFAASRNGLPRNATQLARFQNPDRDPRGAWRQGADSMAPGPGADYVIRLPSGRTVRPKTACTSGKVETGYRSSRST
jgi:adenine-specific DNA-methyltransferase